MKQKGVDLIEALAESIGKQHTIVLIVKSSQSQKFFINVTCDKQNTFLHRYIYNVTQPNLGLQVTNFIMYRKQGGSNY